MTTAHFKCPRKEILINLESICYVDYSENAPIETGCPVVCTTLRIYFYFSDTPFIFHGDEAAAIWEMVAAIKSSTRVIPARGKSEQ